MKIVCQVCHRTFAQPHMPNITCWACTALIEAVGEDQ